MALGAAIAMVGCVNVAAFASPKGAKATAAAQVNVQALADWTTFDQQVYGTQSGWQTTGGYDTLVSVYNGKVVPYLAKSWKQASNNKSITFVLRRDAKCQDGTPITPTVVANSFQRLFTVPKKGTNLAADYGAGPLSVSANAKRWTVTIRTQTAFSALVNSTATIESGIVCPAGLASPTALQTEWHGSGPYSLESATHANQMVLKRNPKWTWGPIVNGKQVTWRDLPKTQIWKIVGNPTTAASDLLTGGLDISYIGGPDLARFRGNSKFTITPAPANFPMTMVYGFGAGHSTNDQPLRAAIAAMVKPVNLERAFNSQGGKLPPLVTSFVQPWQPCYDSKTKALYKSLGVGAGIAKAKSILSKAGYKGIGSNLTAPNGTPVTIRIVTSPNLGGQSGPYLQQAIKPLGANVTLFDTGDLAAFTNRVYGGQQDLGVGVGQSSAKPPVLSTIAFWANKPRSEGGLNVFGPGPADDPLWSRLISAASGTTSCSYWKRAQEHALKANIMLPIAQSASYVVMRKGRSMTPGYYRYEPWSIR